MLNGPINDDFENLYAYNRWANERAAASCRQLTADEYERKIGGGWPSVRDTLVHIGSATKAWHERFLGRSPSRLLTGADVPAIDEAIALLEKADADLTRFVRETPPERRTEILAYTNLQGAVKKVPYWAVFRHAVNHASYHRGQISTMIRSMGKDPKPTDLVFWAIVNTPQE
ncbi:MAG: DinB family protein [Thermoanaerobaculia bacterium]